MVSYCFLLTFVFFQSSEGQFGCQEKKKEVPKRVGAPIFYEDLMLIVVSKERVVALIFTKEIQGGVHYQYRFREKASRTEKAGQGIFCEKIRYVPTNKPNVFKVIDEGSQLFLKNGSSIELEWSYGRPERGWIYYVPERVRVQIGHEKDFKTIDLNRFQQ